MNSSMLLSVVTFVYAFVSVLYIGSWTFKKEIMAKVGLYVLIAGFVGNTLGIILRWIESYQMGYGHAPFSNMYESLVFFSWTVAALYIFVEFKYRERIIGVFATPLIFLAIAYASLSPSIGDRITPLIPALKSNWLIAHVITCFLGYAGFAVAFGFSIMYLIKPTDHKNGGLTARLPSLALIDELTHQMVMFGFLFLSIGIITGAVWANSAWGTYWSWDPKETWSLITWLIYATLLHLRMMRGWDGKQIAWVSIVGFMAVLFTYFGVNLLPGLHSYA
ncbi:cytochrome c-type biogenesis protein CcsB [Desulfocicer vacuolatum DSM 3385]|uniref:Heme exporter protein C n=1 Tax=Desulfocicer vacuolatum DSM 3385 TaxID=1121400 RepID=A0A1W2E1B8_9BACT|nr:c-type cytochrome biogenesis protein CcsB [Desulfocicer vacuolatum]SMD03574.1 cytochrome c-type biogenesis protein CcsB [Desulfocicer vacuolatum DSM 3385]